MTAMTPTEQRVWHIEYLAAKHRVTVVPSTRSGRAWRRRRRVALPPVKSAKTYALALHELGHVLGPTQTGRRLNKEVDAWRWAKEAALTWTPEMQAYAVAALTSYVRWAERRQAADPHGRVFITPDHPVYDWVKTGAAPAPARLSTV